MVDEVLECFVGVAESAGENGVLGSRLPNGWIHDSIDHDSTDPIGEDAGPVGRTDRAGVEVSDGTTGTATWEDLVLTGKLRR